MTTTPVQPAADEPWAYTVAEFAEKVRVSPRAIRAEIAEGRLVASYYRSKPLISREEGKRWFDALENEGRARR